MKIYYIKREQLPPDYRIKFPCEISFIDRKTKQSGADLLSEADLKKLYPYIIYEYRGDKWCAKRWDLGFVFIEKPLIGMPLYQAIGAVFDYSLPLPWHIEKLY